MENCLVTKLKGVVDNDNLEKFGEVKFIMNNGTGTDGSDYVIIGNSGNKPITIDTNGTLQNASNPEFVNKVIPANSIINGYIRKTAVPADTTYLTINPMYNVDCLQLLHVNKVIGGRYLFKNIKAIYLTSDFGNIMMSGIEENTSLIYFKTNISSDIAEAVLENNASHLKVYSPGSIVNIGDDMIVMLQKIQYVQSYGGDIVNLPVSIRDVGSLPSYKIHGTVESFVASMRSKGRTEGCILFDFWPSFFPDLTYGGISVGQHMTNIGLNSNAKVYLSWTVDSISFVQGTAPSSYIAPVQVANATIEE